MRDDMVGPSEQRNREACAIDCANGGHDLTTKTPCDCACHRPAGLGTWETDERTGDRVFFPDYCTDGKHVAFEGKRICYCGAIYFA